MAPSACIDWIPFTASQTVMSHDGDKVDNVAMWGSPHRLTSRENHVARDDGKPDHGHGVCDLRPASISGRVSNWLCLYLTGRFISSYPAGLLPMDIKKHIISSARYM
jgi:hypothetical protein